MRHLACFFKSPEGVEEHDFFKQFELLAGHISGSEPDQASRCRPKRHSVPEACQLWRE